MQQRDERLHWGCTKDRPCWLWGQEFLEQRLAGVTHDGGARGVSPRIDSIEVFPGRCSGGSSDPFFYPETRSFSLLGHPRSANQRMLSLEKRHSQRARGSLRSPSSVLLKSVFFILDSA